jgi:hypothetical protein
MIVLREKTQSLLKCVIATDDTDFHRWVAGELIGVRPWQTIQDFSRATG